MRYFHYVRKSTDDDEHQVLSLDSQERENLRRFSTFPDIEIVSLISESRSAKYPGRPLFNEMLDRIERGEAEGIIAWDPDRLARNSVDGGRIVYQLDTGKLKDLKFATYTFENTAQGKFMLQIVFANAKYHVDSLSVNVRRGNRTKIENGWWPNAAPIGYLNADRKGPKPIVTDPERFLLVRQLFDAMLTGGYTVSQLCRRARTELALTTRPRGKVGGKPLSMSGLYRVLTNPFYAGILEWEGRRHPGKHELMLTVTEFEAVQKLLGRSDTPRYQRHRWAYTGLIRCGCGLAITASEVKNRYGTKYPYYHCTRRRSDRACREPWVRVSDLESQFLSFLGEVAIAPGLHDWALKHVTRDSLETRYAACARRQSIVGALKRNEIAQKNLRHLRVRDQISDADFEIDRKELDTERLALEQQLAGVGEEDRFELFEYFVLFSIHAANWFREGDHETKRLIIETIGSNPTLEAGKLSIDARFPFRRLQKTAKIPELCTALNDVRTFSLSAGAVALKAQMRELVKLIPEFAELLSRMSPEVRNVRRRKQAA